MIAPGACGRSLFLAAREALLAGKLFPPEGKALIADTFTW